MNKELMQNVSESLLRLRFLVMAHFVKPLREIEKERMEFTPGHMHVLGWLKSKGGPVSMKDLACASLVSKPNLTTLVDRLHAEGLVERSTDVNDRRIVNVSLSRKGEEFIRRHKEEITSFMESRLALLNDEELKKLQHAIEDIADVMRVIGERQNQDTSKKQGN
jgi:DNA-binding MarR family transcriptional regulator